MRIDVPRTAFALVFPVVVEAFLAFTRLPTLLGVAGLRLADRRTHFEAREMALGGEWMAFGDVRMRFEDAGVRSAVRVRDSHNGFPDRRSGGSDLQTRVCVRQTGFCTSRAGGSDLPG